MKKISTVICVLLICLIGLSSCNTSLFLKVYYADTSNYIQASGVVDYIKYSEKGDCLSIGFSDLEPSFEDIGFTIEGKNVDIVKSKDIDKKLKLGDRVEFMTAPYYYGDGYVYPIVSITIDGEELLSFDEGFKNWNEWYGK